ncbi:hypothetical protein AVW11_35270 [Streptomyces amritsarensis]|uniref:Uncharacterized protein n=1 Tax=Streptomyces amritsarensis TaxID=681158 RepID=A0ABX3FRM4_9ACTN|nr:hypothetical protein AVW11_35270 [Streptomyces amritsarensis]
MERIAALPPHLVHLPFHDGPTPRVGDRPLHDGADVLGPVLVQPRPAPSEGVDILQKPQQCRFPGDLVEVAHQGAGRSFGRGAGIDV